MSLFGGLYVGTSGLQTSQNALNTVAHNMVNVDTEGYTRQQVSLATRTYNTLSKTETASSYQQVGLGVNFTEVRQVRDYFLDKSYRRESARSGFYDASCDAIEQVEEIFQELDGEAFANALNNLWISVEELDKDPSNTVNQGIFIQRCSEFTTRSKAVYQNLCDYQDDLNFSVKQKVDKMNEIGQRIVDLNEAILKIESSQVEHPNDLKDERNKLVDELAGYASISVDTDIEGNFIIQVDGVDFVTVGDCKKIEIFEDPITGFYTPYWAALAEKNALGEVDEAGIQNAKVINLDQEISSDMNTDLGSLKGVLLARGNRRANFEDLDPSKYGSVKDSVIMNVMAEFDQLVNKVTTGINDCIKQAAENYYGTPLPTEGYLIDPVTKEPYRVFNTSDPADRYSCPDISINETLKQSPSLLGFIRPDEKVDTVAAKALKAVFADEIYQLNPEVKAKTSINNYYNNLISQVANTGYIMRGISANQDITVTNISASREQILGVSTDEELSNMIMFQNAFNASSRYVNALSQMIEHLLATLGQ